MNKPVILTGLRANNDLTLGNYLGALLPLVDMAKKRAGEYQVNLFVPDLHSFTTPIDHAQLQAQIMQNVRVFTAAGLPLDHSDVHIYRQSHVPAHSELTWILDCFTGFGEMSRMTQFKDKARKLAEITYEDAGEYLKGEGTDDFEIFKQDKQRRISVGLFNYPVLMAADILLYDAQYVPVGDDQTQHLEFTRDIATRMNNQFGQLFTVPLPVPKQHEFFGKDQGLRIKDLIDPTKKMSKSDESGRGVIFLSDAPEAAAKKIMSATTDSHGEIKYDVHERPGISNLLQIQALLSNRALTDVIAEYEGKTSYGELKVVVAETVSNFLGEFQANLEGVDEAAITAKLEASETAMRQQANNVLLKAQRAVGLRP
jgi:tryptophanyl-tRNA synthetase